MDDVCHGAYREREEKTKLLIINHNWNDLICVICAIQTRVNGVIILSDANDPASLKSCLTASKPW